MGTKYYLAVDIGASSGRHMLAHLEDGKIVLEEIYRFSNEMVMRKGYKVWNLRRLFHEILTGMKNVQSQERFHTVWELIPGQ